MKFYVKDNIILFCIVGSMFVSLEVLLSLSYKHDIDSFIAWEPLLRKLSFKKLRLLLLLSMSTYILLFFPLIIDNLRFRFSNRRKTKCNLTLKSDLIFLSLWFILNLLLYVNLVSFPEKILFGFIFLSCPIFSVLFTRTIYLNKETISLIDGFSFHHFSYKSIFLKDKTLFFYKELQLENPYAFFDIEDLPCKNKKDLLEEIKTRIIE